MKNGDYILVKAPKNWPGKKYRDKYCYEHHLVYWKKTGKLVKPGFNLHHKDHDGHNNVVKNLEMLTYKEHHARHPQLKTIIEIECRYCGKKKISRHPRYVRWKIKKGKKNFYCNNVCQMKFQHKTGFSIKEKENIFTSKIRFITIRPEIT